MKIEVQDESTLKITPENVSELILLRDFSKDGRVEIQKPRPFESNVEVLLIKKEKK